MATANWIEGVPLPEIRSGLDAAVRYLDSYWFIGGWPDDGAPTNTVYRFVDGATEWVESTPLPIGLAYHCARVYNGRIWAICGADEDFNISDRVFSFDGNSWTEELSYPVAVAAPFAGVIGSDLYVCGGFQEDDSVLLKVYKYVEVGPAWTEVGTNIFPENLYEPTGIEYAGAIWIIGGQLDGDLTNHVWRFNGVSWTLIGTVPFTGGIGFHSATVINNEMRILGGYAFDESVEGIIYVRDTYGSSDGITWALREQLPQTVEEGGAVPYPAGTTWLIGGENFDTNLSLSTVYTLTAEDTGMSSTATITAKVGPGLQATALVLTGVIYFTFHCDQNNLEVHTEDAKTQYFAGYTTITCTKSGSNYTLTIS